MGIIIFYILNNYIYLMKRNKLCRCYKYSNIMILKIFLFYLKIEIYMFSFKILNIRLDEIIIFVF